MSNLSDPPRVVRNDTSRDPVASSHIDLTNSEEDGHLDQHPVHPAQRAFDDSPLKLLKLSITNGIGSSRVHARPARVITAKGAAEGDIHPDRPVKRSWPVPEDETCSPSHDVGDGVGLRRGTGVHNAAEVDIKSKDLVTFSDRQIVELYRIRYPGKWNTYSTSWAEGYRRSVRMMDTRKDDGGIRAKIVTGRLNHEGKTILRDEFGAAQWFWKRGRYGVAIHVSDPDAEEQKRAIPDGVDGTDFHAAYGNKTRGM